MIVYLDSKVAPVLHIAKDKDSCLEPIGIIKLDERLFKKYMSIAQDYWEIQRDLKKRFDGLSNE